MPLGTKFTDYLKELFKEEPELEELYNKEISEIDDTDEEFDTVVDEIIEQNNKTLQELK